MTNELPLPRDYQPFSQIVICSNTLINVIIPIVVGEEVPFLIGDGEEIKIWLNLSPGTRGKGWQPLIRANRSLHKEATVNFGKSGELSATLGGSIILKLSKSSEDIPEITELDLRPLGLNIYGNEHGLNVGSNQLTRSTFKNVYVMVRIAAG